MGTNFYITKGDAQTLDTSQDAHIGLLAHGWAFQFQGKNHKTINKWLDRLGINISHDTPPVGESIVNEYGTVYTLDEFKNVLRASQAGNGLNTMRTQALKDGEGSSLGSHVAWGYLSGTIWDDGGYDFCNYEFS